MEWISFHIINGHINERYNHDFNTSNRIFETLVY